MGPLKLKEEPKTKRWLAEHGDITIAGDCFPQRIFDR